MRYSKYLIPTLKEVPAEATVISHVLMLRSGMIRKLAAGIYNYLPLALRVIRKIENIIREEMDKSGAIELLMPAVQPAELWQESGRWGYYGPELLRFKDRKKADFCLGPTHEEVITHIVRSEVSSYKDLPKNLYQIQAKFRDEIRPRFGLMRGREFIMKDAYSFDLDEKGALQSYARMHATYVSIFKRCGLEFRPVEAGTGAIGGSLSHEFQVLAQNGEDTILACSNCDYAANIEKAEGPKPAPTAVDPSPADLTEIATPGAKTIEEVTAFLRKKPEELCKTLIYLADRKPLAVLIRGDHTLAETKLMSLLKCDELMLADDETILNLTKAPTGFTGPLNLPKNLAVYADHALKTMHNGVCGANKKDAHFINVNPRRDFPARTRFDDLRMAQENENCPRCGQGKYKLFRGIETGQVFFLGTKYSEKMNACVLDENGNRQTLVMGCYGIGVTRTMAAAIEQNHDEHGIIWPLPIAPFQVIICPVGKDEAIQNCAEKIYRELLDLKIEVLLDDRYFRPGVMFKDADLIGIPIRLTIGKKSLEKGQIELKLRRDQENRLIDCASAAAETAALVKEQLSAV